MLVREAIAILERLPADATFDAYGWMKEAPTRAPGRSHNASGPSPLVRAPVTYVDFGRRVYNLMMERGWAQSDLANVAAVERRYVSRYVRGTALPTAADREKLAQAFGVAPESLLADEHLRTAEMDGDSLLEITASSADPTMSWFRVSRLVRTSALPGILQVLAEAED